MLKIKEKLRNLIDIFVNFNPVLGLLLANIIRPLRIFYKIKKRRLIYFSSEQDLRFTYDANTNLDFDKVAQSLLKYGAVVVQNFYDKNQIQNF